MMKSPRLEEYKNIEENLIRDVRNLFRLNKLEKEISDAAIKSIKSLFRLKKEIKQFKTEKLKILGIF